METPIITNISLLSIKQARQLESLCYHLLECQTHYWLKDGGFNEEAAAFVFSEGYIDEEGVDVSYKLAVRPVVEFIASNVKILDTFEFAGYTWTVISPEFALINDCLKTHKGDIEYVTFNQSVYKGNDFNNSFIKHFLNEHFKDNIVSLDILINEGKSFKEINKIFNDKINENSLNRG